MINPSSNKLNKELRAKLDFETMLSDISAQFISASTGRLPAVIDSALERICDGLDCDIAAVWQWSTDHQGAYVLTNLYRRFGGPPVPEMFDAREFFPWTMQKNLSGQTVSFEALAQIPPEGARDRESLTHFGIKSNLSFPLSVGTGGVFGSFALSIAREEREWPESLVTRLQLVAQVCANALARARAEKALKESEARLSLAAESAEAGLWSWDVEAGIIWVTEKARELYFFPPGHEVGYQEFLEKVHPDDRAYVSQEVDEAFRTQKDYRAQYRVVSPEGEIHWISAFGRPYFKAAGKPDRLMGVSHDMTSLKQREREIQQLRLELGHVTRVMMLSELSASLAHELNQPLAAILNNAQAVRLLMDKEKPDLGEVRDIVGDIIKDDKRASDVIRKIRGLVKRAELNVETLDMNSLIAEAADLVRSNLILHDVDLDLELAPGLVRVKGDRVHLQQVFLNLVSNAIEAMRESPVKKLTIRTACGPKAVTVSVIDTGTGIDEKKKDRLFKPFFTTKKDGLGMGLPICQTIVQSHGGQIQAEDNPGGGATFSFSLAVAEEAGA